MFVLAQRCDIVQTCDDSAACFWPAGVRMVGAPCCPGYEQRRGLGSIEHHVLGVHGAAEVGSCTCPLHVALFTSVLGLFVELGIMVAEARPRNEALYALLYLWHEFDARSPHDEKCWAPNLFFFLFLFTCMVLEL